MDPCEPHRCNIPETYLTCEFCSLRVATEQDLQDHVMNDHTLVVNSTKRNIFFNCGMCQRSFSDKFKLAKHTNRCSKYPCQECGVGFAKREDLVRHSMIHTGEKPYQCPICNKRFRQRGHMRSHHERTHGLIPKFQCSFCNASYKTLTALSKHIKRCHPDETDKCISCSNCKIVFQNQESFKSHLPDQESESSFNCDQCCRRMNTAQGLAHHKKTHNYKQISCPICEVQYTYLSSFYKHMGSEHFKVHPMLAPPQKDFVEYLVSSLMFNGFQKTDAALDNWQFSLTDKSILVCLPSAIVTILISDQQNRTDFSEIKRLSDLDRFIYQRDRSVWMFINSGCYRRDDQLYQTDHQTTAHWIISALLFHNFSDLLNQTEVMYRNWDLEMDSSSLFLNHECSVEELICSSFYND
mgnify:CR=1 FL=1